MTALTRRVFWAAAILLFCLTISSPLRADDSNTLVFDEPRIAGISGFRAMWDTPIVLSATGATRISDRGQFGSGPIALWNPDARKISGREESTPGAIAFDAVHRSLLVRFPGAAEKIAQAIGRGNGIAKVELVLPFKAYEFYPENYADPAGMSFQGDRWVKNPPHWHAIAWALRQPWDSDPKSGPTYNASINGKTYWKKFGAQDTQSDRFPLTFGPTLIPLKYQPFSGLDNKKELTADELLTGEVVKLRQEDIEGRIDVSAVISDPAFGDSVGKRLRVLSDQGFLVRKLEVYDARYMSGGYEYGSQTGPRGILVDTPRLIVTLTPGKKLELGALPAPVDLSAIKPSGAPTAVMPSAEQVAQLAKTRGAQKPEWMPAWQWDRVNELRNAGGGWSFPTTPEAFANWIDPMLAMAPRRFDGFDSVEKIQEYLMFSDTWPEPVREHWKNYWTAWLMPDRKISELAHPWNQSREIAEYYAKTRDWRGNTNFYRPYCRNMGTMNFNHTAVSGALLGGMIINSPESMADGRFGLDHFLLRTWSWFDGSTQESLDHYYFAVTLKAQKAFADFGPTPMDRMMGRNILTKSVEELASSYHPNLRSFIASSTRTGIGYLTGIQDGTKHIVHTLSRKGAITDLGKEKTVGAMPVFGHDAPPSTIATQTLNGPWADEWMANTVDEKPLPFEMTVSYKRWGGFSATPLMRRTYMGRDYGMASQDVACNNETVGVMAQWRRDEKPATSAEDLSTLVCRYGINNTNLLDTVHRYRKPDGSWAQNPNGLLETAGSFTSTLQHRNKMVVLTSPFKGVDGGKNADVRSLQTSIGLLNFQPTPKWEVHLNGERVTKFPVNAKAEDRITIKDGVSFLAVIPLASTDLGRIAEVVITDDTGPLIDMQGGGKARPALLIEQYNFLSDQPLSPPIVLPTAPDLAATAAVKPPVDEELETAKSAPIYRVPLMPREKRASEEVDLAFGGFAIEMGDTSEYKDFAAFQAHIESCRARAEWNPASRVVDVTYSSGLDRLEAGYRPEYVNGPTDQCFTYRRVNGAWPYPPRGIERDSTLSQQGSTGKLEKGGAVLTCEAGKMAYLQTEPISQTFAAYNPFPDPVADWSLSLPGGIIVKPDGKIGLTKVVVQPKAGKVAVDYAGDAKEGMAKILRISGLAKEPAVTFNGKPAKATSDKNEWVISLDPVTR